jgi:hypothetical protein
VVSVNVGEGSKAVVLHLGANPDDQRAPGAAAAASAGRAGGVFGRTRTGGVLGAGTS